MEMFNICPDPWGWPVLLNGLNSLNDLHEYLSIIFWCRNQNWEKNLFFWNEIKVRCYKIKKLKVLALEITQIDLRKSTGCIWRIAILSYLNGITSNIPVYSIAQEVDERSKT